MSTIHEDGPAAHYETTPGVFGIQKRMAMIYVRYVNGERQECCVAPANVMEAPAGDYWTAWPQGDYPMHYVNEDRFEAARVVLDMTYGKARA
jgi:hypothetical protein